MPVTDRSVLVTHAYADDRNLAARQAIYRWQRPHHDLPGEVLRALAARRGQLGCGQTSWPTYKPFRWLTPAST